MLLDQKHSSRTAGCKAMHPREYSAVYGKVDIVYADIAQPDQTQIVLENCQMYLKDASDVFGDKN